jgi:uncharacterized protein
MLGSGPPPGPATMKPRTLWQRAPAARRSALASILLALACAAPPPRPAPPAPRPSGPSLWLASHPAKGDLFYLLGSIHYGTPRMRELGEAVDRAYAASEELVLEVDLRRLDTEAAARIAVRYGVVSPPDSLRQRISPRTFQRLEEHLARRGESVEPYLQLEPWLVAMQLLHAEFQAQGLDPQLGVDRIFAERAGAEKPIVALETGESQMKLFATLPRSLQELMVLDLLVRSEDLEAETTDLVAAWERGDDATLEHILFRSLEQVPELALFYERVIFERNQQMAERLYELGRDGKLRFVVVGAAHLVGKRGILALLRARGFQIRKVSVPYVPPRAR